MKILKEAKYLLVGGRSFLKILFYGLPIKLMRDEKEKCFICGCSLYSLVGKKLADQKEDDLPVYVCINLACSDFGQSCSGVDMVDPSQVIFKKEDAGRIKIVE